MPSAKTVAQKPEGSVRPLSSLAHAGLLDPGRELDWFRAKAHELTIQIAARATNAENLVLNGLNRIERFSRTRFLRHPR